MPSPKLKSYIIYFREQRNKYHHHIGKACVNPSKCLSIIMDGMDQAKTDLPQPVKKSKATTSNPWLKTHVTGVMVNGHGNFLFMDTKEFGKCVNLTITVLLSTLKFIMKKVYAQDRRSWPDVLYLQMDNAASENKNKYMLRFCALLVHWGLFKKVFVLIHFVF